MNNRYVLVGIVLLASAFLGIAPVDAREDIFEQAEALSDKELDQISGAGSFWLSSNLDTEITNWYSAQIGDNAFQYAQGVMVPTQVTGDYNSVSVALNLCVYIFQFQNPNALSTFPYIDSLISFP